MVACPDSTQYGSLRNSICFGALGRPERPIHEARSRSPHEIQQFAGALNMSLHDANQSVPHLRTVSIKFSLEKAGHEGGDCVSGDSRVRALKTVCARAKPLGLVFNLTEHASAVSFKKTVHNSPLALKVFCRLHEVPNPALQIVDWQPKGLELNFCIHQELVDPRPSLLGDGGHECPSLVVGYEICEMVPTPEARLPRTPLHLRIFRAQGGTSREAENLDIFVYAMLSQRPTQKRCGRVKLVSFDHIHFVEHDDEMCDCAANTFQKFYLDLRKRRIGLDDKERSITFRKNRLGRLGVVVER